MPVGGLAATLLQRLGSSWIKLPAAALAALALGVFLGRCSVDVDAQCNARNLTDLVSQRAAERKADAAAARELAADHAAVARQTHQVEEAVHALPDARPTARQRARACVVLRQQGAAATALAAAGC